MQINQIQIANAQSNNRTRVEIFEFQIEEVNRINISLLKIFLKGETTHHF